MDLSSLLCNDIKPNRNKTEPIIRKNINKTIEPIKKEAIYEGNQVNYFLSSPFPQNSSYVFENEYVEEKIYVFCVIAKVYLPKRITSKINLILLRMLSGKSTQSTSSEIVKLIKPYKNVLNSWQGVFEGSPQYCQMSQYIADIYRWSKSNNVGNYVHLSFFYCVSKFFMPYTSNVILFNQVLNWEPCNFLPKSVSFLLERAYLFGKQLHRSPTSKSSNVRKRAIIDMILHDIEVSEYADYFYQKRIIQIINKPLKEMIISRSSVFKGETFSPSHHRFLNPIIDGSKGFIINCITKSIPLGHEGGSSSTRAKQYADATPSTKDIHSIMEELEVIETQIDEVMMYSTNSDYYRTSCHQAGIKLFGKKWEEIEPYKNKDGIQAIVLKSMREKLFSLSKEHIKLAKSARVFFHTRPTNAFLYGISHINVKQICPFYFRFPEEKSFSLFSDLSNNIFSKRMPLVHWFFNTVLPIFYSREHNSVFGFISIPIFKSLYLVSLLFKDIQEMIYINPNNVLSFDKILDLASDTIYNKYSMNKDNNNEIALYKILKSITNNKIILDNIAFEIEKSFPSKMECFARFYPILNQLNNACFSISSDPFTKYIVNSLSFFGMSNNHRFKPCYCRNFYQNHIERVNILSRHLIIYSKDELGSKFEDIS